MHAIQSGPSLAWTDTVSVPGFHSTKTVPRGGSIVVESGSRKSNTYSVPQEGAQKYNDSGPETR